MSNSEPRLLNWDEIPQHDQAQVEAEISGYGRHEGRLCISDINDESNPIYISAEKGHIYTSRFDIEYGFSKIWLKEKTRGGVEEVVSQRER